MEPPADNQPPPQRVIPLRHSSQPGDDLQPTTVLIVETTDASGVLVGREQIEVIRPPGPVRQHEQLVQAVTTRLPDARISSAADGIVKLDCRGYAITSGYADALAAAESEPAGHSGQPAGPLV